MLKALIAVFVLVLVSLPTAAQQPTGSAAQRAQPPIASPPTANHAIGTWTTTNYLPWKTDFQIVSVDPAGNASGHIWGTSPRYPTFDQTFGSGASAVVRGFKLLITMRSGATYDLEFDRANVKFKGSFTNPSSPGQTMPYIEFKK